MRIPSVCFAATDAQMTTYCYERALLFYNAATDRDNGFSLQASIADVQSITATASSPEAATFFATNGKEAVERVYSQPTVQPQVWFGYELALCEISPPVSSLVIIAAPK